MIGSVAAVAQLGEDSVIIVTETAQKYVTKVEWLWLEAFVNLPTCIGTHLNTIEGCMVQCSPGGVAFDDMSLTVLVLNELCCV